MCDSAIRACKCINHCCGLGLFYYSWCGPFIAADIYLISISHDLQEKEGGEREQESVCSCVWRGWEAFAKLYINKLVKWAGVMEYLCVSGCACATADPPNVRPRNHTPQWPMTHFVLYLVFTSLPLHICVLSVSFSVGRYISTCLHMIVQRPDAQMKRVFVLLWVLIPLLILWSSFHDTDLDEAPPTCHQNALWHHTVRLTYLIALII